LRAAPASPILRCTLAARIPMAQVVFILGAGASADAGVPLLADFLDTAWHLLETCEEALGAAATDFRHVFDGVEALSLTQAKSSLTFSHLEEVFTAFEMAQTLQVLPGREGADVGSYVRAMESLIVTTIEQTLQFPSRDDVPLPPPPYGDFVKLLETLTAKATPKRSAAVITFNYDIAMDYALLGAEWCIDYGFGRLGTGTALPLLKLHGSLNWGVCDVCGELQAFNPRHGTRHPVSGGQRVHAHDPVTILRLTCLAEKPPRCQRCKTGTLRIPVLVPPTWYKEKGHRALSCVWARAARELREAEYIFVVGYSCPESDSFFRYLYSLGTASSKPLRVLCVVNPDGEVTARLGRLLGPGAKDRHCSIPDTFGGIAKHVRQLCRVSL
jgi:NAD-dependent SIR2 family protein deacetylase